MERWAKKFNSQSETKKAAVKQAQEELRALEQKEEELRKKIHLEKSITSNLAQIASNKVRQIYNILPNIRIPLIRNSIIRLLEFAFPLGWICLLNSSKKSLSYSNITR